MVKKATAAKSTSDRQSAGKAVFPRKAAASKTTRTKPKAEGTSVTHKTVAKAATRSGRGGRPAVHALIIGCDFYLPNSTPEGSYMSLHGCVRDATRVEEFLRARAGLSDDRLIRLTSTPGAAGDPSEPPERRPTYENIVKGFRTLTSRANAGDHVYIHYSGHGGRCPTIVPKVKGKDGLDETLVPIDIGNASARYVRDVEVAKLLREMEGKGLVVTVVIDSCHSGGATRAITRAEDNVGIRGVDFIDRTPRPAGSLVGTVADLAAAAAPVGGGAARAAEATRGMAAGAGAGGAVVLAACRPSELAREFPFDGKESQGALTYWLLSAARQGGDGLTFRTAYDVIQARIHSQFPAQTPMLFGDPDRTILGGAGVPVDPAVPVLSVSTDGKLITLKSGSAGLVQTGAEFAVYPAGSVDRSDAARLAVFLVTTPGAASSTAALTKRFGKRKVQVGDLAVPAGVAQRLIRKVRVVRSDGEAPAAGDKALRQVAGGIGGPGWVELAKPDEQADYIVTTTEDGRLFKIGDPSGEEIVVRPYLPTKDAASPSRVVARLIHLARYLALRQLDNPDPFSPLRSKLLVELFRAPANYYRGDPLKNMKRFPTGQIPRVAPGEWVVLSVTNQSADEINAVALDLGPDWAVSVAHPDEPFHPIDAGGGTWLLPLQAALPDGIESGKDTLKVLFTIDPPPTTELLTLPRLDVPVPRSSDRGPRTRSANPLNDLVDAVTADQPTRALSAGSQPTRGWAVAHVEVEIG